MASCSKWMRLLKSNGPTIHTGRAGPDHLLQLTYDWLTDWMSELLPGCFVAKSHSAVSYFFTCTPGNVRCFLNTLLLFQDSSVCDFRRTFRFLPSWKYFYLHCMPPPSPITGLLNFFLCVFAVHSRCSVRRLQEKKKTPIPQKTGDGQATAQKCWWEETKERRIFPNMLRWFGTTDRPFNISTTITGTGNTAGWEKRSRSRGSREKNY